MPATPCSSSRPSTPLCTAGSRAYSLPMLPSRSMGWPSRASRVPRLPMVAAGSPRLIALHTVSTPRRREERVQSGRQSPHTKLHNSQLAPTQLKADSIVRVRQIRMRRMPSSRDLWQICRGNSEAPSLTELFRTTS